MKSTDGIKPDHIDQLYKNDNFVQLQKPSHQFRTSGSLVLIIVLAVVFGSLAGFFSGAIILRQKNISIPLLGNFSLNNYSPVKKVILTTEKKVTVTEEERMDKIVEDLTRSAVRIFELKKEKLPLLNQIYLPTNALSVGLVLTEDGWLISPKKVLSGKKIVAATNGQKVYLVERSVLDPLTDLVFLKINAQNLPVVKLSQNPIKVGQKVLLYNKEGQIAVSTIAYTSYWPMSVPENLILSSDKFSKYLLLTDKFNSNFVGSPVIDLAGSVVGIMGEKGLVIPTNHFKKVISQVFKDKKISRVFLGIDYLDISHLAGITSPKFKNFERGALVYGPPVKNSPADLAGLQNADLISKINGQPLNGTISLTEIIQEYKPGDEIEITYIREGKERIAKIKLVRQKP